MSEVTDAVMKHVDQEEKTEGQVMFNPALHVQRYNYIYDILFKANPRIESLADFGCAEGKFVQIAKKLPFLTQLLAIDISDEALELCTYRASPVAWDYVFGRFVPLEISLIQTDITQKDYRFKGLDCITCIELIEHLEWKQLQEFPETVFGFFRPRSVFITTPNREFNVFFPQLASTGKYRHWDHKFEWTRAEFQAWCLDICSRFNYRVTFDGVGQPPSEVYGDVGHCSQIGIFERNSDMMDLSISPKSPLSKIKVSFHYPQRQGPPKNVERIDWESCLGDCQATQETEDVMA